MENTQSNIKKTHIKLDFISTNSGGGGLPTGYALLVGAAWKRVFLARVCAVVCGARDAGGVVLAQLEAVSGVCLGAAFVCAVVHRWN